MHEAEITDVEQQAVTEMTKYWWTEGKLIENLANLGTTVHQGTISTKELVWTE